MTFINCTAEIKNNSSVILRETKMKTVQLDQIEKSSAFIMTLQWISLKIINGFDSIYRYAFHDILRWQNRVTELHENLLLSMEGHRYREQTLAHIKSLLKISADSIDSLTNRYINQTDQSLQTDEELNQWFEEIIGRSIESSFQNDFLWVFSTF